MTQKLKCVLIADFNPRLREGGDPINVLLDVDKNFNPRLREGGDTFQHTTAQSTGNFNPRLREGGDTKYCDLHIKSFRISIHASAKEATRHTFPAPLSRAISIHASAKEATSDTTCLTPARWISIHASAKEATLTPTDVNTFNPVISIHASAKEATSSLPEETGRQAISIHASAKEATLNLSCKSLLHSAFQSTPPRRRRLVTDFLGARWPNFNPRLREGGDIIVIKKMLLLQISIHASAKEATPWRKMA